MTAVGATVGGGHSALRRTSRRLCLAPRLRRRVVALALVAASLAGGYVFWLRDSSLVAVETVTVTGITSGDAARVRAGLTAAARQMTTLNVDRERLEEVTAAFPVVRAIEVRPDFPNGMRIEVVEHRPAALLVSGSKQVPVAADGSVLRGLPPGRKLPLVRLAGAVPERRMTAGAALSAVRVAAGLPRALSARVEGVRRDGGRGIVVPIEGGPRLIFGHATRLPAKWAAALRVLADPDAAGAAYVDVRIPERPVAGGLPVATVAPVAPVGQAAAPAPSEVAGGGVTPPPSGPAPVEPSSPPQADPAAPAPPPAPPPTGRQPQAGQGGGAVPEAQPRLETSP